jgi:UDP-N-acetylmuramate dehydrogenase
MKILQNIPLKDKNWFHTGGPANYFCQPCSGKEFQQALNFAKNNNLEIFVLGKGANILIHDNGFDGLVVNPIITEVEIDKEEARATAGSGVDLQHLIQKTLDNNLIGLENFSGIPASVGGAAYMNIHYFSYLFSDFVVKANLLNIKTGEIETVRESWFDFGYDASRLQNKSHYLVDTTLQLIKATPTETAYAKGRADEIDAQRKCRYPNKNTCGCFFRNLEEHELEKIKPEAKTTYAAYYLDSLGVKGKAKHKNACVSEKHANMIVTKENATSNDVITLARKMQDMVVENYGVVLQPECQLVGFKEYPLIK